MKPKQKQHICFNPLCPCLNAKWNPLFKKEIFEEKQNCLKNGSIYKKNINDNKQKKKIITTFKAREQSCYHLW